VSTDKTNPCSNFEAGPGKSPASSALHDDGVRFRLLVENSHDMIVEVSTENEIVYISPNVALVLGYGTTELIGASLFAHLHPDDLAEVRTQFERRSGRATCRYQHKDGSWRWFESTGREFATASGSVHRVVVARDVTAQKHAEIERQRLEAELARAEKLSALGTLAGGMAHDFNNLLTVILAYGELARAHALGSDLSDALDQIGRAADRARSIAQQVLEFSKQQGRGRAAVNLSAIAREVLSLLRITIPAQIEIVAELADEHCTVLGHPAQLHQVLVNLCQNALYALRNQPGRLIVRVAPATEDELRVCTSPGLRSLPHVCLAVLDNGHGMSAATQRRIFEPFFTTKARGDGTGLGLAVVQSIVRDHRGTIDVISQPGQGTEFRILFPAHTPPAVQP